MNESQLVNGLDGQDDLCHVETRDVFTKDFVLDEHSHQVTTRQELHKHVEERRILERSVQFNEPRALSVGENVTLSANVCELILLVLFIWSVLDRLGLSCNDRERTISLLTSDFRA